MSHSGLPAGKRVELVPGQRERSLHRAAHLEAPGGEVDRGHGAVVQHRPLPGDDLARWQARPLVASDMAVRRSTSVPCAAGWFPMLDMPKTSPNGPDDRARLTAALSVRVGPLPAASSAATLVIDDPLDPARHDQVERTRSVRDVEREAVERHPLLHVDADARDLAARGPHAGEARVPLGRHAERRRAPRSAPSSSCRRYQCRSCRCSPQVEDRIAHELPRPVEVTSPPRSTSNTSTPRRSSSAGASGRLVARVPRPSVTTGSCSTSSSRSSCELPVDAPPAAAPAAAPAPRRRAGGPGRRRRSGAHAASQPPAPARARSERQQRRRAPRAPSRPARRRSW